MYAKLDSYQCHKPTFCCISPMLHVPASSPQFQSEYDGILEYLPVNNLWVALCNLTTTVYWPIEDMEQHILATTVCFQLG